MFPDFDDNIRKGFRKKTELFSDTFCAMTAALWG